MEPSKEILALLASPSYSKIVMTPDISYINSYSAKMSKTCIRCHNMQVIGKFSLATYFSLLFIQTSNAWSVRSMKSSLLMLVKNKYIVYNSTRSMTLSLL